MKITDLESAVQLQARYDKLVAALNVLDKADEDDAIIEEVVLRGPYRLRSGVWESLNDARINQISSEWRILMRRLLEAEKQDAATELKRLGVVLDEWA